MREFSTATSEVQVSRLTITDMQKLINRLQVDIELGLMRREDFELHSIIYKAQRDDL